MVFKTVKKEIEVQEEVPEEPQEELTEVVKRELDKTKEVTIQEVIIDHEKRLIQLESNIYRLGRNI